MGRKRTPTQLRILEGNPGKRPIPVEPDMSSGLPTPPPHLIGYAREEWDRLAPGLHRLGILNDGDAMSFAAYCDAYGWWRVATEEMHRRAEKGGPLAAIVDKTSNGNYVQNTLVGTANKARADMVRYASEFGLTPAARAKIAVEGGGGGSKFAGLIGRKANG
jgi:P27 family predicted phage terminase small subunit